MGVFYHPSTFLFISFLLIPPLFADNDNNNKNQTNKNNVAVDIGNINASNPSPSGPVIEEEEEIRPNSSSFKPSIAVIVGVLTTLFSITFLLLLYAKHCKRNSGRFIGYSHGSAFTRTVSARKNSGISRAVVESLPLFRFSSLSGQKDGLECAVCLTRFEPSELLRLLPKCKHAFHVECVDTWLDAHSTCPLCRYRVDPEDILLIIEETNISTQNQDPAASAPPPAAAVSISSSSCFDSQGSSEAECSRTWRVSGRHSYAGERERTTATMTTSFRRSLDSFAAKGSGSGGGYRKDGLLLSLREDEKKRLEHRIIVSGTGSSGTGGGNASGFLRSGFHQRWSDVQPSDLLYLRWEMIISQNRRLGIGSLVEAEAEAKMRSNNKNMMIIYSSSNNKGGNGNGSGSETERSIGIDGIGNRSIINSRSVSEITGLSRFSSKVTSNINYNNNNNNNSTNSNSDDSDGHHQRRQGRAVATAGLVSRWLAWISSTSHSGVQSQPVSTNVAFP